MTRRPPCSADAPTLALLGRRASARRLLAGLLLLVAGCQPHRAPPVTMRATSGPDHATLVAAAEHFVRVFDRLEWEPFVAAWSESPSIFFPFADTPERAEGAAVFARFRTFFTDMRASRPGPSYLRLDPQQLRAEVMGGTGLVTFMLGRAPGAVGRRTLVFVNEGGQWKLAHMHASNAAASSP